MNMTDTNKNPQESKRRKQRRIGIFFIVGPFLGLIGILIAYAVVSFVVTSVASTTDVGSRYEVGVDGYSDAENVDLAIIIGNLINVVLGFLGVLFLIGIITGIPLGIYFLSKSRAGDINATDQKLTEAEIKSKIRRWSWGAFFLNWIWGVSHGVWISLLALIPIVNFGVMIYLGLRGNELAWKNGSWSSIEAFHKSQRRWAIAGWILFSLSLLFGIASAVIDSANTYQYETNLTATTADHKTFDENNLLTETEAKCRGLDPIKLLDPIIQNECESNGERFIRLDSHKDTYATDDFPVKLTGAVSTGAETIVVIAESQESKPDVYTLKDFSENDRSFYYRVDSEFNNLYEGRNDYTFVAYFSNGSIEVTSTVIYFDGQLFDSGDLEIILLNYKIDSNQYDEMQDGLLNSAYNTPNALCPNIIQNRTTGNNVYWLVKDFVQQLENEYGQYRSQISYIDNNLNGLWGLLSVVQDQCEAVGYEIE